MSDPHPTHETRGSRGPGSPQHAKADDLRRLDIANKRVAAERVAPLHLLIVGDAQHPATRQAQAVWQEHLVDNTHHGPTARALAAHTSFDFIILTALPRLEAVHLCRQMRADGVQSPILILSAAGTIDDIITAVEAGANGYLIAPVASEELRAHTAILLRRRTQAVALDT